MHQLLGGYLPDSHLGSVCRSDPSAPTMTLHASTVFARSPSSILSYLSRLPRSLSAHPLLFTISSNAHPEALSDLVSTFSAFSSVKNIGCISAPIPAPTTQDLVVCSMAFFDKKTTVPFRSEIPGRTPTQVGRWHAMRRVGDAEQGKGKEDVTPVAKQGLAKDVDWEDVWSRNVGDENLPPDLRRLE